MTLVKGIAFSFELIEYTSYTVLLMVYWWTNPPIYYDPASFAISTVFRSLIKKSDNYGFNNYWGQKSRGWNLGHLLQPSLLSLWLPIPYLHNSFRAQVTIATNHFLFKIFWKNPSRLDYGSKERTILFILILDVLMIVLYGLFLINLLRAIVYRYTRLLLKFMNKILYRTSKLSSEIRWLMRLMVIQVVLLILY